MMTALPVPALHIKLYEAPQKRAVTTSQSGDE